MQDQMKTDPEESTDRPSMLEKESAVDIALSDTRWRAGRRSDLGSARASIPKEPDLLAAGTRWTAFGKVQVLAL